MLLVTGGTGFIGRSVLRRLTEDGYTVRTLLNPSQSSPDLPRGVSVDVTLASLSDRRSVRASLVGVKTVIHLDSAAGLLGTGKTLPMDVAGTRNIAEAAVDAGVNRLVFLSQLGADRASAYPAMRSMALAEEQLRRSGVQFTILRTTAIFGRQDRFTTSLAKMLAVSPLFFPIPGDGSTKLQPLWVEDLATCVAWILDDNSTFGKTYEIGGPEYISFKQIISMIMQAASSPRILISTRPPYLRAGAWLMARLMPMPPVTPLWLDYLAVDRTTDLNTLPREFSLQPSRMQENLAYLGERNWGWDLITSQFSIRQRG